MSIKNVEYSEKIRLSPWKKISLGSWRPTGDSSVYIQQRFNIEPVLKLIENWNANNPTKISLSHVFAKIFGLVFVKHPELNVVVRPSGIYKRKNVDVFFHVIPKDDMNDLRGLVIRSAEASSMVEIAKSFREQLKRIQSGNDDLFGEVKKTFKFIPSFFSRFVLDFTSFINYALNINLKAFGVPRDPFGSLMITNVGQVGFEGGFTIIAPYTRIPMVVALGSVRPEVMVNAKREMEIVEIITLGLTIDHRVMDGYQMGLMLQTLKDIVANPNQILHKDNVYEQSSPNDSGGKEALFDQSIRVPPSFI